MRDTPAASPASLLVDGVRLQYVEQGSGAPVVLVHGSLADYSYWEISDQIALLAEHHRTPTGSARPRRT